MATGPALAGIDVAKAEVAIALRPAAEGWAVANDAPGIASLSARLQANRPVLIVLEATRRILRKPPAGWPRRTPWTPRGRPTLPRRCGRRRGRCRTSMVGCYAPNSPGGGSCSTCSRRRRIA